MSHSRSSRKVTPTVTTGQGPTKAFDQHQSHLPVKPKTGNSRRRSSYKSGPSFLWLLPVGLVMLVVVALFLVLLGGNQISGRLVAEKTSYDFGQVKLNGGLVTTQIPLKVQDDGVLVSKIATT